MMLKTTAAHLLATGTALALVATPVLAQDITIGQGIFPESIASTSGGDLLIGSFAKGTVYKAATGATTAEPWITGIGPIITGVFAKDDTVYVCSNGEFGSNKATLKTYGLSTAAETGSYDFPGGGFCSDIAVAPDGTVYVTDLQFVEGQPGRLLRLNGTALEVVLSDPGLRGIDGLAFIGDTLFTNDLFTGALNKIDLTATPATFKPLTLSEPLMGPDGMRANEDGTHLILVEQYANRLVAVTVDGDTGTVIPIASDLKGPAGVAQIGNTAYVVEAHFDDMQKGVDPGVFAVRAVALPN